jgi:hypothetical protein
MIGQAVWGGRGKGMEGTCWGNYMLTEPRKDLSIFKFVDNEASCPAPFGNILLTLSDVISHFIKSKLPILFLMNI